MLKTVGNPERKETTISIVPLHKMHTFYQTLIDYPPEGYRFVHYGSRNFTKSRSQISNELVRKIDSVKHIGIPTRLFASLGDYFTMRFPKNVPLIFTPGMVSFGNRPFITDAEEAITSWMGTIYDVDLFHGIIEGRLASSNCKKIICWNDATYRSITGTYDCSSFKDKISILSPGIMASKELPKEPKETIDLLFLGSTNVNVEDAFYYKGGHIVLEVFRRLKKCHTNLRLILRSVIPNALRPTVSAVKDVQVIETPIPRDKLESLLWNSDIMLLPSLPTPFLSFLDGMDHKLPLVTVDTHANSEVVESGKTGFVCKTPEALSSVRGSFVVPDRRAHKAIDNAWLHGVEETISEITEKTEKLIEEPETRSKMGEEGRKNIEKGGRFSIETRNRKLKKALDEIVY